MTETNPAPDSEHVDLSCFGDLVAGDAGLSMQRPVLLHATASHIGVPEEYARLARQFGEMGRDWSVGMRSLALNDCGRMIETFHLSLRDGTKVDFHFDVSSFYRN